mgnify:FL=1
MKMNLELSKEEVAMLMGILGITSGNGLMDVYTAMYHWLNEHDELLLDAAIRMGTTLTNEYETHGLIEEEELSTSLEGE